MELSIPGEKGASHFRTINPGAHMCLLIGQHGQWLGFAFLWSLGGVLSICLGPPLSSLCSNGGSYLK